MTVMFDKGSLQTVMKEGAILNGQDNLFDITGGAIMVVEFVGIVTTTIGGASNCHIDLAVTTPAADVALSTTVAIDSDAAGHSYTFTVATPSILTPNTAGCIDQVPQIRWLCPIGTLKSHTTAVRTGVIEWTMVYYQLSPLSRVGVSA